MSNVRSSKSSVGMMTQGGEDSLFSSRVFQIFIGS